MRIPSSRGGRLLAALLWLCLIIPPGCRKKPVETPPADTGLHRKFQVRVLLLENARQCRLTIETPFSVFSGRNGDEEFHFDGNNVHMQINVSEGTFGIREHIIAGTEIVITPHENNIFNLNGSEYRGELKLIAGPDGETFDAVNVLPLEAYLGGVVGAEMPSYWETEALKAQTIVARSYCLHIKKRFGNNRAWDIKKTQANQAYHGVRAETRRLLDIISQTNGQVLACEQSDGSNEIIPAYYSSVCGGHTENSKSVFGDSFEPLAGIECAYCRRTAKPELFSWAQVEYEKTEIAAKLVQRYPKLAALGAITEISVDKKSRYWGFSRVTMVKVTGGAGGSDFLRGEDFRLAIDSTGNIIKSAAFELVDAGSKWQFINGRGYGHGVGLCQYGAEAMARQGRSAIEILEYYYPGSNIKSIYGNE